MLSLSFLPVELKSGTDHTGMNDRNRQNEAVTITHLVIARIVTMEGRISRRLGLEIFLNSRS